MERYPLDALPSGSLLSELVDFSNYYDDPNEPFRNESRRFTRREMTRFVRGAPVPLYFSQEPIGFDGIEETVEEGFSNLPQEEPLSSNDYIDDQRPEWDISPQVEPNQNQNHNQPEPIQYEDVSQEEQPQVAAPSQEIIYPVYMWVRPLSALLLTSSLDRYITTNSQTNLSASNEPAISNSNDMPVVETRTTQITTGLARTIDVINISPNSQQQQSQSPIPLPSPLPPPSSPPPPPISPQTPPPQKEEGRESEPNKIPVPVLQIKSLAKTRRRHQPWASRIPKKFHCDFSGCNKTFARNYYLKRHMETHSGLKPYKCDEPLCRWTFARLSGLNRHKISKHSSEKRYNCGYCKKQLTRKDHLVKHEKACSVRKLQSK